MNNQVFIQSDFTIETTHEDDILHALIQAQLDQSLAEIEALLDNPPKLSDGKPFTISHSNMESDGKASVWKTENVQRPIWSFKGLLTYIKSAWFGRILAFRATSSINEGDYR